MARAHGSYPWCPRFKSRCRYHSSGGARWAPPVRNLLWCLARATTYGPLVKWLRHRPFTAVTWVRIPYGSPLTFLEGKVSKRTSVEAQQFGGLAQLVRAPASHAGGHWFESSSLHQTESHPKRVVFCFKKPQLHTLHCKGLQTQTKRKSPAPFGAGLWLKSNYSATTLTARSLPGSLGSGSVS